MLKSRSSVQHSAGAMIGGGFRVMRACISHDSAAVVSINGSQLSRSGEAAEGEPQELLSRLLEQEEKCIQVVSIEAQCHVQASPFPTEDNGQGFSAVRPRPSL